MSKFFATFRESQEEFVMFETVYERDYWVYFRDEDSVRCGKTAENAIFQRMAVKRTAAEKILADRIDCPECYSKDENIEAWWIETGREPFNPFGPEIEEKAYDIISIPDPQLKSQTSKTNHEEKECKNMKKATKINFVPTMNLNERKMIASATEKNAIRIGTKKLAWVPVDLMNIKPYQRERQSHLTSIAENWDDSKCNVLTVSYDPENGWFNVVDGQHRAAAARMRGIEYLVCEIFNGMNDSAEARLFVEANVNSKKLSPFDTYKANLFISEKDDTELSKIDKRIAKLCAEYGISVKKSQGMGSLKSVPHTRKIMKNENEGEKCLRFIFDVIQGSQWDKYTNGYSYIVMNALRKVYNNNKNNSDFVKKQMCNYLIKSSPRQIEAIGNNKYANLGRIARWDAVLSQIIA